MIFLTYGAIRIWRRAEISQKESLVIGPVLQLSHNASLVCMDSGTVCPIQPLEGPEWGGQVGWIVFFSPRNTQGRISWI